MRPDGARPAFTKAGPADWALDEGAGSVVLADSPRANGSTPHLWSHTAARFLYVSFFFFDVIFFSFFRYLMYRDRQAVR